MVKNQNLKNLLYQHLDIDPEEQWQGPCASNPQMWDAPESDKWQEENEYYRPEQERVAEAIRVCVQECPFLDKCGSRLMNIEGRVTGIIAGNLIQFKRTKLPKKPQQL